MVKRGSCFIEYAVWLESHRKPSDLISLNNLLVLTCLTYSQNIFHWGVCLLRENLFSLGLLWLNVTSLHVILCQYSCLSWLTSLLVAPHRSSSSGPYPCGRVRTVGCFFFCIGTCIVYFTCVTLVRKGGECRPVELVLSVCSSLKMWCCFFSTPSTRPAFLPDPNDGSLYSLGRKNNEGLTVRGNNLITNSNLPFFFSTKKHSGELQFPVLEKKHTSSHDICQSVICPHSEATHMFRIFTILRCMGCHV